MPTITSGAMTLLDWGRRVDPNGKVARIAELLTQYNEIMTDIPYIMGNTQTGHRTTIRTGLPTVAWRQINRGVQPSKSSTRQIEFSAGILEGHGQVDEALVDLAEDKAGLRMSENAPYIESISQTLATTLFYGDTQVNPDRFTGLSPYYSDPAADSYANVIKAGGTGADNTSLWLVCWGENTLHGFFPRGSKAGITHNDLGKMLVEDGITTGAKYMAYIDQYKANLGLVVRDWRFASRLCNIDVSDLATAGEETDTSANILNNMIRMINKIHNLNLGKCAFYCNRTVKTGLDIQAINKANVYLSIDEVQGMGPVTKFMGIPIRRCDAILNNEALVA